MLKFKLACSYVYKHILHTRVYMYVCVSLYVVVYTRYKLPY